MKEQELILKVKVDNYKNVRNFIANEMGITKPEFEEMVGKYVGNVIVEKNLLEKAIDGQIESLLERTMSVGSQKYKLKNSTWRDSLEDKVFKKVDVMIEEAVGQRLEKAIKDIAEGIIKERIGI